MSFFFFKQKTAYEVRISDWSSDVCSSDLTPERAAIEVCLQAVRDDMLESRWDILCPRCRGAQLSATSLDRLPTRAHCESCNIGYDRDFAHNVELSKSDTRCVGQGCVRTISSRWYPYP